MKDRKPISRTSKQILCLTSNDILDDDTYDCIEKRRKEWEYYQEHKEEIGASEPDWPEEEGYDHWIPFKLIPNALADREDDRDCKVISWDNGILLSHLPVLHTMESLFFCHLVQLDLDDGINLCIAIADNEQPDSRRKFFLKLIDKLSFRVAALQGFVNDNERSYDKTRYDGVTALLAHYRLDNLKTYFINRLSGCGTPLPMPGLPPRNLSTDQNPKRKSRSKQNGDLQIKDLLMFLNMPFILDKPYLKDGRTKKEFFKLAGEIFDIEIKDNPSANINLSIFKGSYHKYLNELIQLIHRYEEAFNLWQATNKKTPKHASMIIWEKSN